MKNRFQKGRWIAAGIGGCLLLLLFMILFDIYFLRQETEREKNRAGEAIMVLRDNAPGLSDEEVAAAVKKIYSSGDAETRADVEDFMRIYGMDNRFYAEKSRQRYRKLIMANGAVLILYAAVVFTVGLWQLRKRNRILEEMTGYVESLNRGEYYLPVGDNSDDEMSRFRNEIYRTTVMLREKAEREEREAEKLEKSLADVSHQLRTPLSAMQITIDNLREHPELSEEKRREFLRELSRSTEHLSELAVMLLKLARLDAGAITIRKEWVDSRELFAEVCRRLEILRELRDVELVCEGENVRLYIDKGWELEAVTNLVKNALEHTPEGRHIYLSAEKTAIFTSIFIRDEGEGILPEDIPHIFERFYKAKNASRDSFGVGLSLAKSIVNADGGEISVSSRQGQGTRFRISFPNSVEKQEHPAET